MEVQHQNTGNGEQGVDGTSVGNVLLFLDGAKKEILEEIRSRSNALHEDLALKIDAMCTNVVHKVLSGVSSHSLILAGSSKSRSSDERKRKKAPSPDKVPFFDLVVQREKTSVIVQWTLAATLYAFSRTYGATSGWIPRGAAAEMAVHSGLFENVSGLSVLFFAVEPGHRWARFHGKVGKMWSYVLRSSITSTILNVRATEFDTLRTPEEKKTGRAVPDWLHSFGGRKQTALTVSEIVQCLETTEEMTRRSGDSNMASKRKRMRLHEPPVDDFEGERDYAVREMRSAMLSNWTYGRAEARKVLLESVMFFVERIRLYPTVAEAKEHGYEIIFHDASLPEENCVPEELSGTMWDIPLARVHNGSDDDIRDENTELLKRTTERFPSLHLTLRYKRAVVCMDRTVDSNTVPAFCITEERVSLHELALKVLTASLSGRSIKSVLQTSSLSLRAVHVLAFGLRGLVRQSLDLELSNVENCALGGVTCEEISRDDGDRVTTFTGTKQGSRLPRGSAASSQAGGASKFTMSLAQYRAEEQRQREARRERERSALSEAGQAGNDHGSDSDIAETWLE